jgi:hypothetical protein
MKRILTTLLALASASAFAGNVGIYFFFDTNGAARAATQFGRADRATIGPAPTSSA